MKLHKKHAVILPVFLLLLLAFAPQTVQAGDGVNGKIDMDLTTVVENTLLSVRFYDLDVSSEYNINTTADATGYTFTTGDDQNEISIPIRVTMPSSGNQFKVWLNNGSGGGIDEHSFFVSGYDDYLDEDQFIDLGIPILVIVIFAGIIVALIAGFKLRG
jgi:hypothetical protein